MIPKLNISFRSGGFRATLFALALGAHTTRGEQTAITVGQDSLTLEDALAKTLERNPDLAVRQLEIEAMDARVLQAGKSPNPAVGLVAENFGGTGNFSGADGLETTLSLEQEIELGGKRAKRKKLAESELELARWNQKAIRIELESAVRGAFIEVLVAQERLRVLQDGYSVNQQILETARLRHRAGKAPATEEMKARMASSLNHIEIDRAAQEMHAARIRLASFWTAEPPSFQGVRGDLRSILAPLPLDTLLPRLATHPDLARWKSEVANRRIAAEAAKADRIPNLTVAGGLRQLNDAGNGDLVFVAGISLPLPLFNRNQGSIREAGYRITQSEREQQAAETRLSARLRALHLTLLSRSEEIAHLKEELLPEAEKTLQASRDAYQLGKLSFLEVLDSQRTLYELATRYLSTLAEYHSEWSELQSLVASGEPRIQ